MIKKECRLSRAAMCFGGSSGGSSVNQSPGGFRFWGNDQRGEQKDIGQGYKFQTGQFNDYVSQNPLLKTAQTGALDFWKQLPGMTSQFPGFQKEFSGYQGQLGKQYNTLGGLISSPYGPAAITASGGALSDQMKRDVDQQTFGLGATTGQNQSMGTIGSALLNRDQYRQQRYNTALQQEQGLLGQQSGLTQMGAGLTGQKAGLVGQQQALQTGGLNQLLGVGNAAVSQFGGLTNPILSYMQGIFGGNQQAAIAQAQLQAQQEASSSGKKGSTAGGAIGAVGSILGAVL